MNIIIVGGGQVGSSLAEQLYREQDIFLIDHNDEVIKKLENQGMDIKLIHGHGSSPEILQKADVEHADMLIAVTGVDEVNMITCQVAYTLFGVRKKIARIRSQVYEQYSELYAATAVPVDTLIYPERLVTHHICSLVNYPGALQVLNLAGGDVQMVGIKIAPRSPLVHQRIRDARHQIPHNEMRITAMYRRHKPVLPDGDTIIEEGDEIFFIAAKEGIVSIIGAINGADDKYQRLIIAGGGNIGSIVAQNIESSHNVKVIEQQRKRCEHLATTLSRTEAVIHGNASDKQLLLEADIEKTDLFIALTNDDEANIMSSLLAKQLGAKRVMTLITNPAYVELLESEAIHIDIVIPPALITIGSILRYVRQGDFTTVHSLRRGAAEALEVVVHGSHDSSHLVGRTLHELQLPETTTVGGIVRDGQIIIGKRQTAINEDDHLIFFVMNKEKIGELENLLRTQPKESIAKIS